MGRSRTLLALTVTCCSLAGFAGLLHALVVLPYTQTDIISHTEAQERSTSLERQREALKRKQQILEVAEAERRWSEARVLQLLAMESFEKAKGDQLAETITSLQAHLLTLAEEQAKVRQAIREERSRLSDLLRLIDRDGISLSLRASTVSVSLSHSLLQGGIGTAIDEAVQLAALLRLHARITENTSSLLATYEARKRQLSEDAAHLDTYLTVLEERTADQQAIQKSALEDLQDKTREVIATQEQIQAITASSEKLGVSIKRLPKHLPRLLLALEEGLPTPAATPLAMQWPARGSITAGFHDSSYRAFFGARHDGLDIALRQGTPIRSIADGIVFATIDGGKGFSFVIVVHPNRTTSIYGHIIAILVEEGEIVRAGDLIALSGGGIGTNGAGHRTTGPHLHLEVLTIDGTTTRHINPIAVLPERPQDREWRKALTDADRAPRPPPPSS